MTARQKAGFGAAVGLICGFLARDLDLTTLVSFWGDRLVLLPLGLLVGTACGVTRLRGLLYATALALALLWFSVAYGPVSRWLVAGLVRSDALRPADAVLVLSSNVQTDGDPSSVQLARLYRGLELVRDDLAPRLIITELPAPYSSLRGFAQTMLTRFSPGVELVVLGPVRNTHDESEMTIAYLMAHDLTRLIVTSSPTHTFRSAALFEGRGLEVMATPSIETRFDLETLDRSEERLGAFGSIIHERLGILVYRYRGWIR